MGGVVVAGRGDRGAGQPGPGAGRRDLLWPAGRGRPAQPAAAGPGRALDTAAWPAPVQYIVQPGLDTRHGATPLRVVIVSGHLVNFYTFSKYSFVIDG